MPGCGLWDQVCLEGTALSFGVLCWRERSPARQGTRHGTTGLSTEYLTRAEAVLSPLLPPAVGTNKPSNNSPHRLHFWAELSVVAVLTFWVTLGYVVLFFLCCFDLHVKTSSDPSCRQITRRGASYANASLLSHRALCPAGLTPRC